MNNTVCQKIYVAKSVNVSVLSKISAAFFIDFAKIMRSLVRFSYTSFLRGFYKNFLSVFAAILMIFVKKQWWDITIYILLGSTPAWEKRFILLRS